MSNQIFTSEPVRKNLKLEQGLQSRARLVAAARTLFESHGYSGTSTEALLAATGLTKGALYHHFRDKRDLFLAVCEDVHRDLAQAIEAATHSLTDVHAQLLAGSLAWIDTVSKPGARQVLLIDAPAVLGANEWAELDARYGYRQLREALVQMLGPGQMHMPPHLDAAAAALNGAINALAHWRAQNDGPAAMPMAEAVLRRLCDATLEGWGPDVTTPVPRCQDYNPPTAASR